jgi:hypothetical protein
MCVQVTKTANRFEISSLLEKILLKQVRWCLTFVGLYTMTNKINSITTHIETTKCIYIYIIYFCCRYKGKHIEVKMFLSDFVHRSAKNNFNVCGK